MKTSLRSSILLGALLLGLNAGTVNAQLLPVTAGAFSTTPGSKLKFVNGATYTSASGYIQLTPYSRFANRFGTNLTYGTTNLLFQALSYATNSDVSAAPGAYIACQVLSVTGPVGGTLFFWEQGAGWPTYKFPVNGLYAAGKNRIMLSNPESGAGRPDGDPFGAVRGRKFTVDKAGDYAVTFKLYDISQNNPTTAGPIHPPSDPLTIKFSTYVDLGITQIKQTNNVSALTFKQGFLTNMVVESSTDLTAPNWTVVSGPFATTPTLTTNIFTNDIASQTVFYRLRGVTP
ncbi:MAG: Host specificity protein [Verrucomicrobiales bacterium]|jgi:hypothetical protein|nr:Host specificity protein [Verrucomicrobiales bacterium]